jgi:hypothetical protein
MTAATAAASFFGEVFTRTADPVRSRARIARVARLLDSAFVVPGTNLRIGLDPLIGLVPGAGDAVTTAMSAYIVYEAYRAGLPPMAVLRMIVNILIDFVIGAVPVLGDFGNIFWRANRRNLAIFDAFLARRRGGAIIEGSWRRLDR